MNAAVLEHLEGSLRGPRRARADMLAEIRDGLEDATEAYRAAGLSEADARRRAEADFGDPTPVADDLQTELAARYGLRSALIMALLLPVLNVMWDSLWMLFPASGWTEPGPLVRVLSQIVDVSGLALAGLCALGVVVLATRVPIPVRFTLRAVAIAVVVGVVVIGGLSMVMVHLSSGHDHFALPSMVATASSYAAGTWFLVRAGRCLHLVR